MNHKGRFNLRAKIPIQLHRSRLFASSAIFVFPSLCRFPCCFSESVPSYHDDGEGRFLLQVDADVRKYTASCPRRQNVHSYGRDKHKSNNITLYYSRLKTKCMPTSLYWRTQPNSHFTLLKNSTYFVTRCTEELDLIHTSFYWRNPRISNIILLKNCI